MKHLNLTALLLALSVLLVGAPAHATPPVAIVVTSLADDLGSINHTRRSETQLQLRTL